MYSSVNSAAGRLFSSAFGKRAFSSASAESGRNSRAITVRCYSISGKRAPQATGSATARQQQQQQQQSQEKEKKKQAGQQEEEDVVAAPQAGASSLRTRVPKFTIARTEFMMADLFARHRQVVVDGADVASASAMDTNNPAAATTIASAAANAAAARRPSFKTLSELALCKGQTPSEADIPHAKLRQIYAAPSSVYMQVATPDAMIPEAMRLGPLTEPLLGLDTFSDGFSSLSLGGTGSEEEIGDFVEEFFDAIIENTHHASMSQSSAAGGSVRRQARREAPWYQARWMQNDMLDPVDAINDGAAPAYQMTSVRRKRKTKMNKHKHRKLRKEMRSLKKRLGK
ncbi:hypothetical protein LPJ72_001499 [Coemansia sp. Benny D160-2]|nr:hypothetical protein LPJ72_001499 [Coemansia sp. Benny D160-2]